LAENFPSPAKKGSKNSCFGGLGGEIFDLEVETPLGNQSPPEHVVWRKKGGDTPKNVFSRAAQEITKTLKSKKNIEYDISPIYRGAPAGPTVLIFCVLSGTHDVIMRTKF